ncbi:MAG TPA: dTDP-4-dehydrorhamnose 3,5-epimerase [Terriglobia bacterium]|nr:dTDP-4-dehydrorhamnose 3,5-epimerase [Terriglobia bacterium]
MRIQIESTHLNGVVVIVPEVFEDERGFFMEVYRADQFRELGLPNEWPQDNHSRSDKGVLRGLHFQYRPPVAKLMRVTYGTAFLVAVDIRKESPTLGKWFGLEVSAQDKKQVYAPAGFARGFCALSAFAEIQYRCTQIYNPQGESGIRWDDPDIGIDWPISNPTLSVKDSKAQCLAEWLKKPESNLFGFQNPA